MSCPALMFRVLMARNMIGEDMLAEKIASLFRSTALPILVSINEHEQSVSDLVSTYDLGSVSEDGGEQKSEYIQTLTSGIGIYLTRMLKYV